LGDLGLNRTLDALNAGRVPQAANAASICSNCGSRRTLLVLLLLLLLPQAWLWQLHHRKSCLVDRLVDRQ